MAMGIQVNTISCYGRHLITVDKAAVELGA